MGTAASGYVETAAGGDGRVEACVRFVGGETCACSRRSTAAAAADAHAHEDDERRSGPLSSSRTCSIIEYQPNLTRRPDGPTRSCPRRGTAAVRGAGKWWWIGSAWCWYSWEEGGNYSCAQRFYR